MDALARLVPVAHPLLAQVDAALAMLGAPAEHPIWELLRRLGTTPADAVGHVADLRPEPLHEAARALRAEAESYRHAVIPAEIAWSGAAGDAYRVHTAALAAHLGAVDAPRQPTMVGQLVATAAYAEAAAEWAQAGREGMARALADVLSSTQAVRLRGARPGDGLEMLTRTPNAVPAATVPVAIVLAAADIGVWLLAAAEDVLIAGQDLHGRYAGELGEVSFRPPEHGPSRIGATVRLGP